MAGFETSLTITGIQEAQSANLRAIAALRPEGALGRAVVYAVTKAHQYAVAITHVDTGSLRASHRIAVEGMRARVYIDPVSVNPRTGQRPSVYGIEEHDRGGDHRFYERVVEERGREIAEGAMRELVRGL